MNVDWVFFNVVIEVVGFIVSNIWFDVVVSYLNGKVMRMVILIVVCFI